MYKCNLLNEYEYEYFKPIPLLTFVLFPCTVSLIINKKVY